MQPPLRLVGTQAQINADLLTLRYNAPNSAGTVDMEMRSSSVVGTVGDNTAAQDIIVTMFKTRPQSTRSARPTLVLSISVPQQHRYRCEQSPIPPRWMTRFVRQPMNFQHGNLTVTGNTWPT